MIQVQGMDNIVETMMAHRFMSGAGGTSSSRWLLNVSMMVMTLISLHT